MIGYRSNVFHMTYCTRYCLKSPLEHLTITFSFLTGLYFFQHWFFFSFLFISSSWRKRTHCVKADRTRIRPTVCAGCIQGLQALPFSSPIAKASSAPFFGAGRISSFYPLKYWETKVLAHFSKLVPEPEENRCRDGEHGKLHIPCIWGSVFALGIIVKEYKVCCYLSLGICYHLKLGLGLEQSQILLWFTLAVCVFTPAWVCA